MYICKKKKSNKKMKIRKTYKNRLRGNTFNVLKRFSVQAVEVRRFMNKSFNTSF